MSSNILLCNNYLVRRFKQILISVEVAFDWLVSYFKANFNLLLNVLSEASNFFI